jgi:hypothetical protein
VAMGTTDMMAALLDAVYTGTQPLICTPDRYLTGFTLVAVSAQVRTVD